MSRKQVDKQERPPIEHVAWVFQHLADAIEMALEGDGPSFRYLIYDMMGYGQEAYELLYDAGGMYIANAINCIDKEKFNSCWR